VSRLCMIFLLLMMRIRLLFCDICGLIVGGLVGV